MKGKRHATRAPKLCAAWRPSPGALMLLGTAFGKLVGDPVSETVETGEAKTTAMPYDGMTRVNIVASCIVGAALARRIELGEPNTDSLIADHLITTWAVTERYGGAEIH